jgi:hypothetical protein
MSNNEARWVLAGGMRSEASAWLWIAAASLMGFSALAQVETVAKVAQAIAGEAASRDAAYLAIVFAIGAMAFAWWQSRQVYQLAHEANVAAVETARALQRLVDHQEGKPSATLVDDDIGALLSRRKKR